MADARDVVPPRVQKHVGTEQPQPPELWFRHVPCDL